MEKYDELIEICGKDNVKLVEYLEAWKIASKEINSNIPTPVDFLKNPDKLSEIIEKLVNASTYFKNSPLLTQNLEIKKLVKIINFLENFEDFNINDFFRVVYKDNDMIPIELENYLLSFFEIRKSITLIGQKGYYYIDKELYTPFNKNNFIFTNIKTKMFSESKDALLIDFFDFKRELGENPPIISKTDPIENPEFKEGYFLKKFENVLVVPPFDYIIKKDLHEDEFSRFYYSLKSKKSYLPIIEHSLSQTNGKAVILLPIDFLSDTTTVIAEMKKNWMEKGWIEQISILPKNILYKTNIQTVVLVLNKNKTTADFELNDYSSSFVYDNLNRKNILNYENKDINIFSVTYGAAQKNNFNFSIINYEKKSNKNSQSPEKKSKNISLKTLVDTIRAPHVSVLNRKELEKFDMNTGGIYNLENFSSVEDSYNKNESKYDEFFFPISNGIFADDSDEEAVAFIEINNNCIGEVGFIDDFEVKLAHNIIDKKYLLKPYDVLISIKGKCGLVGIMPSSKFIDDFFEDVQVISSQNIIALRCKDKRMAPYVYTMLRSIEYQEVLERMSQNSSFPLIKIKDLLSIEFPEPTDSMLEQAEEKLKDVDKEYKEIIESYSKLIKKFTKDFPKELISEEDLSEEQ
jgi:hypothetical protein